MHYFYQSNFWIYFLYLNYYNSYKQTFKMLTNRLKDPVLSAESHSQVEQMESNWSRADEDHVIQFNAK